MAPAVAVARLDTVRGGGAQATGVGDGHGRW
jgi:hypothetical protein